MYTLSKVNLVTFSLGVGGLFEGSNVPEEGLYRGILVSGSVLLLLLSFVEIGLLGSLNNDLGVFG